MTIRKIIFTEKVVKHWNRLSRAAVGTPALEAFKRCVDMGHGDMVWG